MFIYVYSFNGLPPSLGGICFSDLREQIVYLALAQSTSLGKRRDRAFESDRR